MLATISNRHVLSQHTTNNILQANITFIIVYHTSFSQRIERVHTLLHNTRCIVQGVTNHHSCLYCRASSARRTSGWPLSASFARFSPTSGDPIGLHCPITKAIYVLPLATYSFPQGLHFQQKPRGSARVCNQPLGAIGVNSNKPGLRAFVCRVQKNKTIVLLYFYSILFLLLFAYSIFFVFVFETAVTAVVQLP